MGVPLRLTPSWLDRPMPPSASASPTSTWLARKATTHTANIRPATAAAIMPMSMASQGLSTPHESTAITEYTAPMPMSPS